MTLPGVTKRNKIGETFFEAATTGERDVLKEDAFKRMIAIERKRTERSREPFLLMLLESGTVPNGAGADKTLAGILVAMQSSTRETDVVGWYKDGSTVGVLFTGLV